MSKPDRGRNAAPATGIQNSRPAGPFALSVSQVLKAMRLAEQYGVTLGELKLGDKVRS